MEAILQIFYISMAIYGWNQWNKVSNEESVARIKKWEKIKHAYAISLVVILALISGEILTPIKKSLEVFDFIARIISIRNFDLLLILLSLGRMH